MSKLSCTFPDPSCVLCISSNMMSYHVTIRLISVLIGGLYSLVLRCQLHHCSGIRLETVEHLINALNGNTTHDPTLWSWHADAHFDVCMYGACNVICATAVWVQMVWLNQHSEASQDKQVDHFCRDYRKASFEKLGNHSCTSRL